MLTSVQGPYYLAAASHIVHQILLFLYLLLLLAIVVFQLLPSLLQRQRVHEQNTT